MEGGLDQLSAGLARLQDSRGVPLEESDELILVADDKGRYVAGSRGALARLGYSADELKKFSIWDLTPGARELDGLLLWQGFVRSGRQSGTYSLRMKSGLIRSFEYDAVANAQPGLHVSTLRELA